MSSSTFAGTKVGTGGVNSIQLPAIGDSLLDESLENQPTKISKEMAKKLKKLGIESLILDNGEAIDLNDSKTEDY